MGGGKKGMLAFWSQVSVCVIVESSLNYYINVCGSHLQKWPFYLRVEFSCNKTCHEKVQSCDKIPIFVGLFLYWHFAVHSLPFLFPLCQSGGAGCSQHAALLQAVRSGESGPHTGDVALLFRRRQVSARMWTLFSVLKLFLDLRCETCKRVFFLYSINIVLYLLGVWIYNCLLMSRCWVYSLFLLTPSGPNKNPHSTRVSSPLLSSVLCPRRLESGLRSCSCRSSFTRRSSTNGNRSCSPLSRFSTRCVCVNIYKLSTFPLQESSCLKQTSYLLDCHLIV